MLCRAATRGFMTGSCIYDNLRNYFFAEQNKQLLYTRVESRRAFSALTIGIKYKHLDCMFFRLGYTGYG